MYYWFWSIWRPLRIINYITNPYFNLVVIPIPALIPVLPGSGRVRMIVVHVIVVVVFRLVVAMIVFSVVVVVHTIVAHFFVMNPFVVYPFMVPETTACGHYEHK